MTRPLTQRELALVARASKQQAEPQRALVLLSASSSPASCC